jgi:hypothetical protein
MRVKLEIGKIEKTEAAKCLFSASTLAGFELTTQSSSLLTYVCNGRRGRYYDHAVRAMSIKI